MRSEVQLQRSLRSTLLEPDRPFESRLRRWLSWQVVLSVQLLISCQSTSSFVGDQFYESGDYAEAEAAFVEYLESSSTDGEVAGRALYRLGVIYASPKSSMYDPQRSIKVLDKLVSTYPGSPYTPEAMLLRNLLLASGELELERQQKQLQLQELEAGLVSLQKDIFMLQKQLGVKEGQITELQQSIPLLEAEIQHLLEKLEAVELELEQLDRLKAIDLESPPPRQRR